MAIKTTIVADDGLTKDEELDCSEATLEELRAAVPNKVLGGGFAMIQEIEDFWTTHLSHDETNPKQLTLAWYASQMVELIDDVRLTIASGRADRLEYAALAGVRVGQLHEEARSRFHWGEHVRRHRKNTATNRASAKQPRPRGFSVDDVDIAKEARRLRQTTPYARNKEQSTRWLAEKIRLRRDIPLGTVRDRLKVLKIR